ncbi:MAG: lamin tail domain-containing protein [Chitinispirillaceae bacterium]
MLRACSIIDTFFKAASAVLILCVSLQSAIVITEIHYHPLGGPDTADKNLYEFIEIKNTGNTSRGMDRCKFIDGIEYSFPAGCRLEAGEFIVLAADSSRFEQRYGFAPFGIYNGKLSNGGERITLVDTLGEELIADFEYDDKIPWPLSADGSGFSLVPVNSSGDGAPEDPDYWRASSFVHGSPGSDDTEPSEPPVVYVNEILTHTDEPSCDAVELFNPSDTAADISGWFITDNKQKPKKFRIPDGTEIEPKGYVVFDEGDFNKSSDPDAFAFSSHGEGAYIFSALDGELTGYSHGFSYGEIDNGVSFGRYVTSAGEEHCVAMVQPTLGKPNSSPRVGPLVITEINYNPSTSVPYVEIKNISAQRVDLFDPLRPANTWEVNGLRFKFPPNVTLSADEVVVLVSDQVDASTFRAINGLDQSIKVFTFAGTLRTGGEALTIRMPCDPYLDDTSPDSIIPYMDIDRVSYSDDDPWPLCSTGSTLYRKNPAEYGDDPANWSVSSTSPGTPVLNSDEKKSGEKLSILPIGKNMIRLVFPLKTSGSVDYTMTDLRGVMVKSARKKFPSGINSLDIDIRDLTSGAYVLRVQADGVSRKSMAVIGK